MPASMMAVMKTASLIISDRIKALQTNTLLPFDI